MTSPTPEPTLTEAWIEETMFDHIAVLGCIEDKWKRLKALTKFGHQVKATLTASRQRIAELEAENLKLKDALGWSSWGTPILTPAELKVARPKGGSR